MHRLYRFQLTNEQILYQHVQSQPLIERYAVVDNWHNNLSEEGQTAFGQLMTEANFINVL